MVLYSFTHNNTEKSRVEAERERHGEGETTEGVGAERKQAERAENAEDVGQPR
jgi:hypothetical protein